MPSTCAVSGNIQDLTGTVQAGYAVFRLVNYGDNIPRVLGITNVATNPQVIQASAGGAISTALWGNDNIDPAGTFYLVTIQDQYQQTINTYGFSIVGTSFNLNSATPITTTPVVSPPTGDTTYLRLDAGNFSSSTVLSNSIFRGGLAYDAKDYGAVGNGIADDTSALNLALTSIVNNGGGTLYLPIGNYLISSALTIGSNVEIRGVTGGGSKITCTSSFSAAAAIIVGNLASQTTAVAIRFLEINGAKTGSSATATTNIQLGNVNGAWVEDCYLHDAGTCNIGVDQNTTGFGTSRSQNVFIRGNRLGPTHNINNANIQLGNGNGNTNGPYVISGNTIAETDTGNYPIDINGSSNVTISGNYLSGGLGLQIESGTGLTSDISITGNVIQNGASGSNGVSLVSELANTTGGPVTRISIVGNTFLNMFRGIYLFTTSSGTGNVVSDVTISGNVIQGTGGGAGIFIQNKLTIAGIANVNITGNQIDGTGAEGGNHGGIVIDAVNGVTGLSIGSNSVTNNDTGSGIYTNTPVSNQGQITVYGNDLTANPGFEINSVSYVVIDRIKRKFTPNSNSFNFQFTIPVGAQQFLLSVEGQILGTAGAYTDIRGCWLIASWLGAVQSAFNTGVSAALANQIADNALAAAATVTGQMSNQITVNITNAANNTNVVNVTLTAIGSVSGLV